VGAALRALTDFGRMRTIQLAVFVDRGHRELPVEANFIGRKIPTKDNEIVEVRLSEIDGEDAIYVMEKA
jgi:pyrimidine operon attenuation protein/uracil phosphoribosyltransferase